MINDKEGGLCIVLSEDTPTIVKFGDKVLKIYTVKSRYGYRARFVADRSIQIISPNRVKKGWMDAISKEEGHKEEE